MSLSNYSSAPMVSKEKDDSTEGGSIRPKPEGLINKNRMAEYF